MLYHSSLLQKVINSKATYIVIILIISSGVYLNTLSNGFVYDDEFQILKNAWITDVRFIPQIFFSDVWAFKGEGVSNYYRPLMHLIYMIDYRIFGLKPWGFHLTNIIFHAGVSILVFFITLILFDKQRQQQLNPSPNTYNPLFAFIAALLFATHPIHTEAVAWVGSIPDLLFTFLYLLSFYFYIKADSSKGKLFVLSLFFFFLSTLCKETALTLPPLLIAYDYSINKKHDISSRFTVRSIINLYLPYLIVAGIYFILRTYAIEGFAPLIRHVELSNWQYFINIFPLFAQYLEKLILPINLNVFYVLYPISSIFEWKGIIALMLTLTYILLIYFLRKNGLVFFSLLWIVIPLLPVLYIPALGENAFAERYLYMPSVGFVFIISAIMENFYQLKSLKSATTPTIILTLFIIAGLYAVGAIKRNTIWENNHLLWEDAVAKSPDAPQPHNNLGKAFYDKGLIGAAMDHYQVALKLKPAYPEAQNNLGIAYFSKGLLDKAAAHFEIALRLRPNFAAAHSNLGVVYQTAGHIDKAIEHYQTSLKLRPNNPIAHNNLGRAYYDKGLIDRSIEHYKEALRIQPDFKEAVENIRKAYENRREK